MTRGLLVIVGLLLLCASVASGAGPMIVAAGLRSPAQVFFLVGVSGRGVFNFAPSVAPAPPTPFPVALLPLTGCLLPFFPPSPRGGSPTPVPVANPIACENTLPGNPASEWDISGAGDASIQGFATDISVDQGQTVRFKINSTASAYRLDIYRLGYYGGMGARKVATVRPTISLPQAQPACLNDATTGLIDCGNWAESVSWTVPTDAVSGIYIAKAVRESGRRRLEPHRLRRPRRRRAFRSAVPDVGHDVAGLQPVRRQQSVRRIAGGTRVQSQLQPADHDARDEPGRLALQRGVSDAPLARSQRLQRQLRDRRRHRSPRRRAPRAQSVHVGRPRRVLVRRAARQRGGGARRRRPPRVLQRQRGLLEDALGKQHGRVAHAVSHAGHLQRNARQRGHRSGGSADVDRHVARPAVQPAGRRRPARRTR